MATLGWNGATSANTMKLDKSRSANVHVTRRERALTSGLGAEEEGERGERRGNDESEACRGEGGEAG